MELKNIKYSLIFVSTCLIIGWSSCKKVTGPPINTRFGEEFFPIKEGKFIEYRVDSLIYNDFTGVDEFSTSYIKEVMDSTFLDAENRPARYVVRYVKRNPTDAYEFSNLFYIVDLGNKIEVVDNNLRIVKLILPITYKGIWKGNSFVVSSSSQDDLNWMQGWDFRYESTNKKFVGDSLTLDSTLTVLQTNLLVNDTSANNTQYSEYTYSDEVYAKNIGLVKKEILRFKRDPSISNNKKKGFYFKKQVISYN